MCPVKPNNQVGKRLQNKESKKSTLKKDTKKKGRGKNLSIDDSQSHEEEQQLEEIIDDKPKRESWLDNLPPVIKPDEELHQELTKKRKEMKRQKHLDICKEEANAILNFVFNAIDADNDPKKMTRLKIDFLNGKFIPTIDVPKEDKNANKCPIGSIKSNLSNLYIMLEPKSTDIKDSLNSLYKEINFVGQFDANPELNSVLQHLQESMVPYTNPAPLPAPVDFPFVICVTGPPHSGRTSITQFIHRFFKTFYINVINTTNTNNTESTNEEEEQKVEEEEEKEEKTLTINSCDDKFIIGKISEILPKIEPNCGLLIRNYPLNKAQAALLEKALNAFGKHKQSEIQNLNSTRPNINSNQQSQNSSQQNLETPQLILKTINCVFRTSLTADEAQAQMAGRLINVETGEIFHEKFRPPSVLDNIDNIKPFIPQDLPINANSYSKIANLVSQLEILTKKGTLVIPIHLLDSTDKLELQIENVLRQIYEGNNFPVPFSSFVHFRNLDQLNFAKYCNNAFDYWNDKCIPIFGETLSKIYERIIIIKEKIDYFSQCAKNQFLLNLLQKDKRNAICDEFLKQKNEDRDYGQFFKEFWDLSLMIREYQKSKIDDILNGCGLSRLKGFLSNREGEIFEVLMKRFFIVEWYFKLFRNIDSNSDKINNGIPPLPNFDFDINDFTSLAKQIGIKESLPIIFLKSPVQIIKPEINKTDDICKNSISFGFKNRSVSQQKVIKPNVQQRSFFFCKPDKKEINLPRSQSSLQENNFHVNSNAPVNSIATSNLILNSFKYTEQSILIQPNINSNENESNAETEEGEITVDMALNTVNSKENSPRSKNSQENSISKEKIDIFLKFLSESLTVRVLRTDATILLSIFRFLTNEIETIEKSIDERIKDLRETMVKWINTKYSQEMEEFSEKFREMKKSGVYEGNLYEIKLNFKQEEESDELVKRLMPYLSTIDTAFNFDKDKMINLMNLIPNDTLVLSMDEILKYAKEVEFSEEELADLEITITMSTIPDFVDIKEFRSSFTKNET